MSIRPVILASMTNFKHTRHLLSEPTFLAYAGNLYHDFLDLEPNAVVHEVNLGEDFRLNVSRWHQLCKDQELKRPFGGGVSSYLLFARNNAGELLRKDWIDFNKSLSGELKKDQPKIAAFVQEAVDIKETVKRRAYLEPLASVLEEVLNSILAEYGEVVTRKRLVNGQEINLDRMRWNANVNILSTLFYDLARKEVTVKGKRMMALEADPEQIKSFIAMCFTFRGDDISVPSLNTHFDENRAEKRATSKKIPVDGYFEHEDNASKQK